MATPNMAGIFLPVPTHVAHHMQHAPKLGTSRRCVSRRWSIKPLAASQKTARPPSDHLFQARHATTSNEFRAAGYLRAASFYIIPSDRSELARRAHLRMKGDASWDQLELHVSGKDPHYEGVTVVPFVATIPYTPGDEEAERLRAAMPDASCMLPAMGDYLPEIVVGTLDLNQGARLPAEELIGRRPAEGDKARLRGYLSNVCVAEAARRRGIAKLLINAAVDEAVRRGIQHLYVHVVADNTAARQLYIEQCGFQVEQQESEGFARTLNRPRRMLLYRSLEEAW